jgi:hypothetical protein
MADVGEAVMVEFTYVGWKQDYCPLKVNSGIFFLLVVRGVILVFDFERRAGSPGLELVGKCCPSPVEKDVLAFS